MDQLTILGLCLGFFMVYVIVERIIDKFKKK